MDLLMKLAEAQDELRKAERGGDPHLIRGRQYLVDVYTRLIERKGL
jgi:hypothetical protein